MSDKFKIYTRTGDNGTTSLFSGERVKKNDPSIQALGSIDECNCAIGFAISMMNRDYPLKELIEQLETIQHALFDLGAAIATPRSRSTAKKIEKTRFDHEETALLEKWIDEMVAVLPPLTTFILPGGHPTGASIHLARSICRRAEREIIPLIDMEDASKDVFMYLNRLSDYLFIASRWVNQTMHSPETLWVHNKLTS